MLHALDLDLSALAKPVRAFSKGMTQKLGLAGCLLGRKDLYILDEPTSGLDPKARALLKRRLRELRSRGHTIFFTSHSLADVEEICDRMAVIHRGRAALLRHPRRAARAVRGQQPGGGVPRQHRGSRRAGNEVIERSGTIFDRASGPNPGIEAAPVETPAKPDLLIVDDDPLITDTLDYRARPGLQRPRRRVPAPGQERAAAARQPAGAGAGRPRPAAARRTVRTRASS